MKIIKTKEDHDKMLERQKKEAKRKADIYKKAIEGCGECPFCGERLGNGNILVGDREKFKLISIFTGRYYCVKHYTCFKCGAEWESDIFEY